MKLGCLVTNDNKINPKTSKRLSTGGCCRRRRKLTMATNQGMAAPRGWFGIVRKKFLVKTKLKSHNKNIIIIHNNTSIACNEEDNRASSCVEPSKDQTAAAAVMTKNKDGGQETQDQKKKKKPDAGDLDNKTSMITTTNESGDQENGLKDQKEKPDDGVVEGDSSIVTNKDVGQEVQDFKKKPDTGVIEDKSSTIASTNEGGAQENGLKEHNKKPDDVGVEDDSSMMTMKNEGGKDDQKNSDDNVNNVEGKLILRNEDTEADPSTLAAAQAALSVDSGKRKEERRDEQVVHSDVEKAMAAIRIQTTFRGHLARRAFRALKGLVRLQAVVRGVVVRRQARMALHCMRALVRLGDRVRARQLLSRSSDE